MTFDGEKIAQIVPIEHIDHPVLLDPLYTGGCPIIHRSDCLMFLVSDAPSGAGLFLSLLVPLLSKQQF